MKIQIFDREIGCCVDCVYYKSLHGTSDWFKCANQDKKLEFECNKLIHSTCKFLQPLTKESIKSLGFIFKDDYENGKLIEFMCIFDNIVVVLFYKPSLNTVDIIIENKVVLFNFIIENLEHLKFVLRGFGFVYSTK